MQQLFDRILEIPGAVMKAWMTQQPVLHPASCFAFLLDRDVGTVDAGAWASEQGLADAEGNPIAPVRLALHVVAQPESVLIALDRSATGQDLICCVAQDHAVASFFLPDTTCLLSLPIPVPELVARLVDDLGRWREDQEDPPLPGSPGLVLSGQRLPPRTPPKPDEGVRNAMFAGPPGRRWLIVPPHEPTGEIQLVRLADTDLELLVVDLLHRDQLWGPFDDARAGWERSVEAMVID